MPVELARYRGTVAKCRPVKVSELRDEEVTSLGFELVCEMPDTLWLDWHTNNPDHPFTDSWAWRIELKGKKDD